MTQSREKICQFKGETHADMSPKKHCGSRTHLEIRKTADQNVTEAMVPDRNILFYYAR